MWIAPVYDRTYSDIRARKRKAYINTSDLNRIENNTKVLADILHCNVATKEWKDGEFIFLSDLNRIKSNLEILTETYTLTSKSPEIPTPPFSSYWQWNDIEKIIYDLHSLFYANKRAVSFCSEIYVGSQIGVI